MAPTPNSFQYPEVLEKFLFQTAIPWEPSDRDT